MVDASRQGTVPHVPEGNGGTFAPEVPTVDELEAAWARTDLLFSLIQDGELSSAPVAGHPPLLFHLGHLATFAARAAGCHVPTDPELDDLFGRPASSAGSMTSRRWPRREQVEAHRDAVRSTLRARWLGPTRGAPDEALGRILDHEARHHEQLLGLLQHLPGGIKRPPPGLPVPSFATAALRRSVRVGAVVVPPGALGQDAVAVPPFRIASTPIMNGEFFEFLACGAYDDARHWTREDWDWRTTAGVRHPRSWRRVGHHWLLRGTFEDLPLERVFDWPVCVSLAEARAYLTWKGLELPTEAEWHAAGGVTPDGAWQRHPWGDGPPRPAHGNFGLRHWSPTPVGSAPEGQSPMGVHELLGNGWEWTSSVDATTGRSVVRGASWATALRLVSRSSRRLVDGRCPLLLSKFRAVERA